MDYVRVTSEPELAEALQRRDAFVLRGGTDLVVKMRAGSVRPGLLVDVSDVASLRKIDAGSAGMTIGAAVPIAEILRSPAVGASYPLLIETLRTIGSPQIRARGTLGGNLANASPAADSALPLLAYGASVTLATGSASRSLPLERFFQGPGRTSLERGEYIRSIDLPRARGDWATFFHKVGRRQALTIAIASVAGLLALRGGEVDEVRLAAGSVAPTPLRLRRVETLLAGRALDAALIDAASHAAAHEVSPIDDVRASASYRRDVCAALVARFLSQAASGTLPSAAPLRPLSCP